MRIGDNPQRNKRVDNSQYIHQIIMPVYIPNLEGYYKESFDVFKLSINSLIKTVHSQSFICVVSNGCCDQVVNYIFNLLESKQIHEVINTTAIGKVNAILKGLAGAIFPIVTITDADVLFVNNWQQASYDVFNNFPKCGVVCPTPNPRSTNYKNGPLFYDNLFTSSIFYSKIKNVDALLKFAESINELKFYQKCFIDKYLVIKNKQNFKAAVGAGHFIATYKMDIFNFDFIRKTNFLLGGDSEGFLDIMASKLGLWRLTTLDNYAYHMGNGMQNWFKEHYNNLSNQSKYTVDLNLFEIKNPTKNKIIYYKLVNKLFDHKLIRKFILNKAIISKHIKRA